MLWPTVCEMEHIGTGPLRNSLDVSLHNAIHVFSTNPAEGIFCLVTVAMGFEFSGQKNTIVSVILFYFEAFIPSQRLKLHRTLDCLVRGVGVLWKDEYFPTGMVNKETAA